MFSSYLKRCQFLFIIFLSPGFTSAIANVEPLSDDSHAWRKSAQYSFNNILGPKNSGAFLAGSLGNNNSFSLDTVRLEYEEMKAMPKSDIRSQQIVLLISGKLTILGNGWSAELNPKDTVVLGCQEQIILEGLEETNEIMLISFRNTPQTLNPKSQIVYFNSQSPVRNRGAMWVLSNLSLTFGLDKLLSQLGPKNLYLIMGKNQSFPHPSFAAEGPSNFSLCLANIPPNDEPCLYTRRSGFEIFFVISGKYRITYGQEGENSKDLNQGDLIVIPPSHSRNFTNISDEDAMLAVMVVGLKNNENQTSDMIFPSRVINNLRHNQDIHPMSLSLAQKLYGFKIQN